MSNNEILQIIVFFIVMILLVKPVGWYMAFIYKGDYTNSNKQNMCIRCLLKLLRPIEQKIYKLCDIIPDYAMNWKEYAVAVLIFSFLGFVSVYAILRLQIILPLNYQKFAAVSPDVAFNTAASFVTNTNWQAYAGESTLSYFSQMIALTVQNFISAAMGISILLALIRGLVSYDTNKLGNFWVDTVRSILYVFLPLSFLLAILLVCQGVPQNFNTYQKYSNYQQQEQIIPMGPVASQIAIKQLGTNGGGFFNANASHPFENPRPLTNFLEMLAMILIPSSLCYTFGIMLKNIKHGWNLLITMLLILIPCLLLMVLIEHNVASDVNKLGVDNVLSITAGNMEGKELRFGVFNSSLWAIITSATNNGSVNSMFDSFLPLGGILPLWLINLGGVVFGGVGSGLYQMLIFVFITVFICGLMIGRTPEYFGKKIDPYEMKMVSFSILIMPLLVLVCSAIAVSIESGKSVVMLNKGIHGFTEILYAFSSMANNNGSMLAGLNVNDFYNVLGGIVMLIGRYFIIIPILAVAGSLAKKKIAPVSVGALPINSLLFIGMLISVILVITALVFLPALSLGPIVEHLYVK